ncbi:MAG TPA: alpha/beta fold hydrolase [Myxococcales bacterium]|jgi:triacylglycerol lipase|nr:alpha/beta fold hydrolase [Myxococcales bacterium]
MHPLVRIVRRVRRQAHDLRGYFAFDRRFNQVVRRTDFTQCPKPVLLIYGFLGTRRSFEVIERRLRRDGYCVFSINLGGMFDAFNTHGIDETAERVRDKIERLYARYTLGPLSIIGHSKGGLIGRYYVKRLGGHKRVQTLVTLGTPHNGSPTAYLGVAFMGAVAPSVWQMTPMSPFIRRLKMGRFPDHVRLASLYSKQDRFCPFPSALLETDGQANLQNVELKDCAHREFLTKKRVYDVIRRELEAGEAARRRLGIGLVSEG